LLGRPSPRALAWVLAGWFLTGCGPADAQPQKVRGVVIDFAATSITKLQHFDVRGDDGQVRRFRVEGEVGITPGHTREHMLRGEPITVTFRDNGQDPIALLVED